MGWSARLVGAVRGRAADHHHGPAPQVRPVLAVRDLDEAERLHRAMGLEVRRHDDGYAWIVHEGHEVWHLRVVADLDPAANHAQVYVFVDDVDAWWGRAREVGLDPTPVRDEPWGMREFAVIDPSGNRLRLGCNA